MKKHIDYSIGDKRGRTPTYLSWCSMMSRCFNKNRKRYKTYGAVGITVCKRWCNFDNFLTDMGNRPKGKTIDRIENDKGYSLENCRWATYLEQTINSKTAKLKVGEVQLIRKICFESKFTNLFISKMFKVSQQTIQRIRRNLIWKGI